MSSLAHRGLRATAAAAGLAAIGVGLAGPAFAAPAPPAGPDATPATPAAPAVPAAPQVLGNLPAPPSTMSDLPQLFTFEGPQVNTAGPQLPTAPDTGGVVTTDAGVPNAPAVDPQKLMGQNAVGAQGVDPQTAANAASALQKMDAAKMFSDTAQQAAQSGLTAGNRVG